MKLINPSGVEVETSDERAEKLITYFGYKAVVVKPAAKKAAPRTKED